MRGIVDSVAWPCLAVLFFLCEFGEMEKSEVLSKDGLLDFLRLQRMNEGK